MEFMLELMTGFNVLEDYAFALVKEQLLCFIMYYMVKGKLWHANLYCF